MLLSIGVVTLFFERNSRSSSSNRSSLSCKRTGDLLAIPENRCAQGPAKHFLGFFKVDDFSDIDDPGVKKQLGQAPPGGHRLWGRLFQNNRPLNPNPLLATLRLSQAKIFIVAGSCPSHPSSSPDLFGFLVVLPDQNTVAPAWLRTLAFIP
jgi:hypothetical protein